MVETNEPRQMTVEEKEADSMNIMTLRNGETFRTYAGIHLSGIFSAELFCESFNVPLSGHATGCHRYVS